MLKNNGILRLRCNHIVILEHNRIGCLECNFVRYVELIDHLRNRSNFLNC